MSNQDSKAVEAPMEIKDTANTEIQQRGDQLNERGFRDKMFEHFVAGDFCDVTLKAGKDKKM